MKPFVHIITGSFCKAEYLFPLRDGLVAVGYESVVTQHLSCGKRDPEPAATMEEDARHIRAVTEAQVEQGKDVVLVMHSYGGIPGTESANGLLKTDREKEGKQGGIVKLVYMSALAVETGMSLNETMAPLMAQYVGISYVKMEGHYMFHDPKLSAQYTFSDLPAEEGLNWANGMVHHSLASFNGKLTYPAYNFAPIAYIVCNKDLCVPADFQRQMIERMEKESGQKVQILELDSGHCPFASRPKETVEVLVKAVEQPA